MRIALALGLAAAVATQQVPAARQAAPAAGPDPVFYTETRTTPSTYRDRGPSYAPTYLIYADKQRTGDEGKKLVDDLGMLSHLDEYKARAFVVGPLNGAAYDPGADLEAFKTLLRTRRSSNLKIIGVGSGATFVNIARIAGVAGHSAPFGPPALLDAAAKNKGQGKYLPMYAIAGNRDMYKPLPVNDTPRSFYTVIRAFATTDDIAVPDTPNLAVNEMFGVKIDGSGWSELGGRRAMIGTLSNTTGAMMRLVALDPYGHWNYKPAAEDMWSFLSKFRRDLQTGALQITPAAPR